uniref:Endonuclease/exonuclease/phosphatase domain-containing protein n=1 Tax=Glycine max TaxID=3847 RepID=K7KVD7_SOYBN
MKIITYNIRGLGRGLKWALIRKLVKKERADMLCLQETKREVIDKKVCQALWGDSDASWELQPACNSAGGLLCIWNEETFKLENKLIGNGSIYLEGIWLTDGGKVMIVNIYLSCICQRMQDEGIIKEFNEWIADLEFEDVPCVG